MSRRLLAALVLVPLVACAPPLDPAATAPVPPVSSVATPAATIPPSAASQVQWTITVVRHAEPAPDGTDDPPLAPAGQARAERLAGLLAPQQGVAVLASPYRRTQQTASPAAAAWGVDVTTYDPAAPAGEMLLSLLSAHPSGSILIVGHSNTVQEIVGTLCGCEIGEIDEAEHGLLYQLSLDADGNLLDSSLTEGF